MKHLILIAICLILSACSSSGNDTSPLVGTWFTQSCAQGTDSSGTPVDSWAIGKYEFTSDGLIKFDPVYYDDSQCIVQSQQPITTNTLTPPSYIDSGVVTLQEGIQGHSLSIVFQVPNDVFTIESFYTINNSVLCFSDTLTFEPLKFGFSQIGGDAINFNDCLVK
jgi:hypothetical protein